MDIENFIAGSFMDVGTYKSFIPTKIYQDWTWTDRKIDNLLEKANYSLGELNSYSTLVPNIDIYIQMHIVTEANKSNRIEGTKTSIEEDLMPLEDLSPEKRNDHLEVQNYIEAMHFGIRRILVDDFPLSGRLIRELHAKLLQSGRGQQKLPGEFRKSQNWIGGSKPSDAFFVPPIHQEIPDLLTDLERFINDDKMHIPQLVKAALVHYQFETIHPFLDGNGRIGRLIIPLYLMTKGLLKKPSFYISDYFEKRRYQYYDTLTKVRTENKLNEWIIFFLEACLYTSENAKNTFSQIFQLVNEYRDLSLTLKGKPENIVRILEQFYASPVRTIADIVADTELSYNTVSSTVKQLEDHGILTEITGSTRNKLYLMREYVSVFSGND